MRTSSAGLITAILLCFIFAGSFVFAQADISEAILLEQSVSLEPVKKDTLLEDHLREKALMEQPPDPETFAAPEEIPFEVVEEVVASESADNFKEVEKTYEKADALEPVLMLRGAPVEEEIEAKKKEKLKGLIVLEKHHIKRRRFMYRWVLKTEDGMRIPLKSNLQLLTAVRNQDLLDGPAMLTGSFVNSAMNAELRYFNAEKIVSAGDSEKKSEKISDKKKP